MRKTLSSTLWGLFFISIGILIVGNIVNFWDVTLFFDGWWTLFLIIPCAIRIISDGIHISPVIGLTIGILLLLMRQDVIDHAMTGKLIIPIIFVIIGLGIIFKNMARNTIHNNIHDFEIHYDKNSSYYTTVFHSRKIYVPNEPFYGASLNSVFGDLLIDLTGAIVTQDIVIHCSCAFGDIQLLVPPTVNIKPSGTQVFGSLKNHASTVQNANKPTIYIDYSAVFGEIVIR
ncbi:LiaF transmembrane domain-containing protein [Anaerosporobacter faecicola]|uniref:LiaF transmembrane domain-containing protein n=1 Tax=Anaerosporobacter faecicola TaxID=2718714 RepID=UPI00143AA940|nr:LiaF domain-containing protein [Anaerosporobacter faecicola]